MRGEGKHSCPGMRGDAVLVRKRKPCRKTVADEDPGGQMRRSRGKSMCPCLHLEPETDMVHIPQQAWYRKLSIIPAICA